VKRRMVIAALVAGVLALGVGCSDDKTVGEGLQTEGFDDSSSTTRLGGREETTTTVATSTPAQTAPASTTPTTAAGPAIGIEVRIQGDNSTSQFAPSNARIYEGTCARFTNADTAVRSVVADDSSFSSGDIAPGASANICPSKAGRFNYHDGTRPYAVGTLEVLAK